jgi:hypothetical protein
MCSCILILFTTLAAEKMVIALVEGNDLAHMLGLWHLSKISTLQLIELKLPPVLLVCRESVISIR